MTQKPVRLKCSGCGTPFRARARTEPANVRNMAINSGWQVAPLAEGTLSKKQLLSQECYCRKCSIKGRIVEDGWTTFTDSYSKQQRDTSTTRTFIQSGNYSTA